MGLSEAYRLDLREVGSGRGVSVTLKSDSTVSYFPPTALIPTSSSSVLRGWYPRTAIPEDPCYYLYPAHRFA